MLTSRKKRRFHQTNTRPVRALCLVIGLITLAACAERTDSWSPVESPKKNRISWAEFHHPVKFAKSSAKLDETEKETLTRFIARVGSGQGVTVMLATGSAKQSPLIKRRETSLARYFLENGIAVSRIQAKQSTAPPADTVRVTVGRYLVKPPACADWSKPAIGDPNNGPSGNYGCATETNLGLMVANPEVLVRGSQIGPADGEALAVGIKAYRNGEVKKPSATSARTFQGGGGGS